MAQYIIYCRKSTESEEKQILSIDSQIKELKDYCQRLNLPISVILTESKSAKSPGRPVFNDLVNKLSSGQYNGIICWKLDRLARNPIDGSTLVWMLDQGKIKEILTPHGFFKNNSNDKFMMQIEFGMAKKYVDDLSDNVKRGLRAKLENGWLPSLPPLGYLNNPKDHTIIKDPDRFDIVRKAWDFLFGGHSPLNILKILNNQFGLRTRIGIKIGGKPLSLSSLYQIFGNPFYYGLIERKEGIYSGKHVPMISEDEYWKAQDILGRRGRPRPKRHRFAFTGLIKCGECGCSITAEIKINRYGDRYVYYHCTKKKYDRSCLQKYVNINDLEEQIIAYLSRINVSQLYLDIAIDYLSEKRSLYQKKNDYIFRAQKTALTACQKKLGNLNQMRLRELIGDDEYLKEKIALMKEKAALELHKDTILEDQATEKTINTLSFASNALETFKKGSLESKRSILQEIGSNFILKDKILIIKARKPLQIIEKPNRPSISVANSLEPLFFGSTSSKLPPLALEISSWQPQPESNWCFQDENLMS